MNYLYGKVERFTFWVVSASMNTCDACKWWTGSPRFQLEGTRRCEHPKGYSFANSGTLPAGWVATSTRGGAFQELYTGPKFGCVHWEAKDAG